MWFSWIIKTFDILCHLLKCVTWMGMRTGNVDKEKSDDRNETRVVESKRHGNTMVIFFQGWSKSVLHPSGLEEDGTAAAAIHMSAEDGTLRRWPGREGKGTHWDLWNWERNSQIFQLGWKICMWARVVETSPIVRSARSVCCAWLNVAWGIWWAIFAVY